MSLPHKSGDAPWVRIASSVQFRREAQWETIGGLNETARWKRCVPHLSADYNIYCKGFLFVHASINSRVINKSMVSPNKATPTGTPASDFQIGASLVRALLEQQHPDLAHLACAERAGRKRRNHRNH